VAVDAARDALAVRLDEVRDALRPRREEPEPITRATSCMTDGCGCTMLMAAPLFRVERGAPYRVQQVGTALTCPRCGAAWTEDEQGRPTLTGRSRGIPKAPPDKVDSEGHEVLNELADSDMRWSRGRR